MKKLLRTTAVLLLLASSITTNAQNYKMSVGARLGSPISASFKLFVSDANAVEVFANYRSDKVSTIYGNYGWSWFGVGASYQMHADLDIMDGLQWYYGAGVSALYYDYGDSGYYDNYDNISFGLQGNLGLDYKFANAPVNLSLDWVPTYYINGFINGFGAGYGALSVRYVISE